MLHLNEQQSQHALAGEVSEPRQCAGDCGFYQINRIYLILLKRSAVRKLHHRRQFKNKNAGLSLVEGFVRPIYYPKVGAFCKRAEPRQQTL